ncbi:hypothetical protein KM043_005114 [Ampulex compressa]|nr:hypothetical protein KM043_005114 [Ampulex compressa]
MLFTSPNSATALNSEPRNRFDVSQAARSQQSDAENEIRRGHSSIPREFLGPRTPGLSSWTLEGGHKLFTRTQGRNMPPAGVHPPYSSPQLQRSAPLQHRGTPWSFHENQDNSSPRVRRHSIRLARGLCPDLSDRYCFVTKFPRRTI